MRMSLPTGLPPARPPGPPRRRRRAAGPGGGMRRPNRARLWFTAFLGVVLAGVAAVAVAVLVNRQPGQSLGQSVDSTLTEVLQGGQEENLLLIGNNARDASTPLAPGQADLMVVVHFDPRHHTVTLISVPRDALVAYPGYHDPIPKLKSALLMGGPKMETQAVSRFLGMPIQGYVEADFSGFAQAINAVGGVWVDIPARLYDPLHSHANFEPGYQHLNGSQALAYIRIRQNAAGNGYRVNDFQRMQAAYQVLLALKHQVLSRLSPGGLSHLVGVLSRDFATNLSTSNLIGLAASADHATFSHVTVGSINDAMTLRSAPLPGVNSAGAIEGADYDVLTPAEIARAVAPYGGRNPTTGLPAFPPPQTLSVAVSNTGEGQTAAANLRAAGFSVTLGGVAPTTNGTLVVTYPAGHLLDGLAVAHALGLSGAIVQPGPGSAVTVATP
jgi:LCP family protein required for cell wall assembly